MFDNPLHEFRSYSTHTLLFLCKDSNSAEALADVDASQYLSVATNKFGMFVNGPQIVLPGAVLVCNTLRDANPIISKIQWTTYLVPGTGDDASTLAVDGKLMLNEYKTFDFFKHYNDAVGILNSEPTSAVWVIKNIWIGHPTQGPSQYIADVKPFMMWLVDVTASYDMMGGAYTLSMVGMANGISKNTSMHVSSSGQITFTPNDLADLGTAMAKLSSYYQSIYDKNAKDQIDVDAELGSYKRIKYTILVDPQYATSEYKLTEFSVDERGPMGIEGATITLYSSGIEQSIHELMKRSKKIKDDSVRKGNSFSTYKILSYANIGDDVVELVYKVVPFITPVVTDMMSQGDQDSAASEVGQQSGHYTFKYLNTGQNIDVLNFDIRVDNGLTLMQNIHTSVPVVVDNIPTQNTGAAIERGANYKKPKKILTPSTNGSSQRDRSRIYYDNQLLYDAAIAKHAFIETIGSKITILGNPNLMGRFNVKPSDIVNDTPDWAKKFLLCKVDVAIPNSDNHHGKFDYQRKFWYEGFYVILSIEQIIEGNTFRQELELMSLPIMDAPMNEDGIGDE